MPKQLRGATAIKAVRRKRPASGLDYSVWTVHRSHLIDAGSAVSTSQSTAIGLPPTCLPTISRVGRPNLNVI